MLCCKTFKILQSSPFYGFGSIILAWSIVLAVVNTLVITGYGTNSHLETAHTARLAGSDRTDCVHFSDISAGHCDIADYNFLIFPGGFLDGDNLGAAQAAAVRWRYKKDSSGSSLLEKLRGFLMAGGLVLGICNGFQLLVKLGILPALDGMYFERQVSLGHNASGRFEDRWVHLQANPACPCIFTQNLPPMIMPVRHGEGRLIADENCLSRLWAENLIALQYVNPQDRQPTMEYPFNPNGSPLGIAGLSDPSGHVLGLMPHPEAFHHVTNHPGWTRGEIDAPGTLLFVNAVRYLRNAPASGISC